MQPNSRRARPFGNLWLGLGLFENVDPARVPLPNCAKQIEISKTTSATQETAMFSYFESPPPSRVVRKAWWGVDPPPSTETEWEGRPPPHRGLGISAKSWPPATGSRGGEDTQVRAAFNTVTQQRGTLIDEVHGVQPIVQQELWHALHRLRQSTQHSRSRFHTAL